MSTLPKIGDLTSPTNLAIVVDHIDWAGSVADCHRDGINALYGDISAKYVPIAKFATQLNAMTQGCQWDR